MVTLATVLTVVVVVVVVVAQIDGAAVKGMGRRQKGKGKGKSSKRKSEQLTEKDCFMLGCFATDFYISKLCEKSTCGDRKTFRARCWNNPSPAWDNCAQNGCWDIDDEDDLFKMVYECFVDGCYGKKAITAKKFKFDSLTKAGVNVTDLNRKRKHFGDVRSRLFNDWVLTALLTAIPYPQPFGFMGGRGVKLGVVYDDDDDYSNSYDSEYSSSSSSHSLSSSSQSSSYDYQASADSSAFGSEITESIQGGREGGNGEETNPGLTGFLSPYVSEQDQIMEEGDYGGEVGKK